MSPAAPSAAATARHSAIYRGRVVHRRHAPKAHAFDYRLFMLYLDLDELPHLFDGRWLWSHEGANVASIRSADLHGDPGLPLADAVRATMVERIGRAPDGPVRVLTTPRTLGIGFNPVSFYYAYQADGSLGAVMAEITNTPWLERHAYVLDARESDGDEGFVFSFDKTFHVSPFMPMDQRYTWRFGAPGERLAVTMQNHREGELVFDAALSMQREPVTAGGLARCLAAHPAMAGKVVAAIYWQALRLWLKRTPFHPHPDTLTDRSLEGTP